MFDVLEERHAEEVADDSRRTKSAAPIEAHRAFERFGRIERHARAATGLQLGERRVEEALRDSSSLAFRKYRHAANVSFV
jgi:hypothetical protein